MLAARTPVLHLGFVRLQCLKHTPLMVHIAGKKDQAGEEDAGNIRKFEKKIQDNRKRTEEEKLMASDFLLKYARYNLGPAMMGKLVSREVQEAMYQLHIKDQDFWTVPRLAIKFGLKYNRTAAVLMSKFLEKKAEKRLAKRGEKLDFELERLMGEEFGWIATENFVPTYATPSLSRVHSGDEVDFALIAKAYEKRDIVPPPHQVPAEPPKFHIPKISGPTRVNKLHRRRMVIMDVESSKNRRKGKKGKKVPNEEKFMMIRDFDGSLRTPSWQERSYICRRLVSAPEKDRGKVDVYPHDIQKVLHPRIPFMRRTLRLGPPKHTPRGPNAKGETPKHIPRKYVVGKE